MSLFVEMVLASGNAHKRQEISVALAPMGVSLAPLADGPAVEETEDTFIGNALLKARAYAKATGKPALADDSGLEVEALDGAPGIYSARFAADETEGEPTAADNNAKLLRVLSPGMSRRARFVCALVLVVPAGPLADSVRRASVPHFAKRLPTLADGGEALAFYGATQGTIVDTAQGTSGFGYDPLFLSEDLGITFGEAGDEAKGSVSHRARAVALLARTLDAIR